MYAKKSKADHSFNYKLIENIHITFLSHQISKLNQSIRMYQWSLQKDCEIKVDSR